MMRNIKIVYFKELLDTIRDRRTIISMVVIPIFIIPLFMFGFSSVIMKMEQKSAAEIHKVMIINRANAPELCAAIDTSSELQIVQVDPDSIESLINNKLLGAALIIPDSFTNKVEALDSTSLMIVYNEAEVKSNYASEKLFKLIKAYRDQLVQNKLIAEGINPDIILPFTVDYKNVAEEKMGSMVLSMLLPYMIIILCMAGAMYPAIDLTAGEKERGTLETILVSPIPRWQLATGKFLTILTTSIISTILVLSSMVVTFLYFGASSAAMMSEPLGFEITPLMVVIIFLMMIPTAALLAALLMSVSLFAKSYKEAQSYASPMMIVAIIPALVSFIPGIELNFALSFIPLMNISLSIKDALMGHINWLYIIIIFISTAAYAAFAIFVAHRLFEKESVIFRS